ncbi:hypothetical protein EJ06DRAFT_560293 [Trichodelitschia bisporula]|uniref:RBR-type E3 ubiquitin transferase n=1 Tax=Trichodelitschia bisporula TaxID=703511 RepID=A0A6G1HJ89_9PEZI|nr:hypothetical protein EJ06DRAFT_560293 [Trichodelitschia bisporula]
MDYSWDQYEDMDDASFALALQMEEIENGRKDADNESLIDAFEAEIQNVLSKKRARSIARSPALANPSTDWDLIELSSSSESEDDIEMWEEMPEYFSKEPVDPSGPSTIPPGQDNVDPSGPSTSAPDQDDVAPQSVEKLPEKLTCSVCFESHPSSQIAHLACTHQYCFECLKDLFLRATKDESLCPPRCCKTVISVNLITPHLSVEELETYKSSELEFSTNDRTYCYNCKRFIPPTNIKAGKDGVHCSTCWQKTCVFCKNAFHTGGCPEDPALRRTLKLAEQKGWQRCKRCKSMVARETGCLHITCTCGFNWCYCCQKRWQTCRCTEATLRALKRKRIADSKRHALADGEPVEISKPRKPAPKKKKKRTTAVSEAGPSSAAPRVPPAPSGLMTPISCISASVATEATLRGELLSWVETTASRLSQEVADRVSAERGSPELVFLGSNPRTGAGSALRGQGSSVRPYEFVEDDTIDLEAMSPPAKRRRESSRA